MIKMKPDKINITKISITLFILATALFFMSLHMVDTSFNIDSSCFDRNFFGVEQSKTEMYQRGYMGLLTSFFILTLAFLMFF
jgi:hypothetical protein